MGLLEHHSHIHRQRQNAKAREEATNESTSDGAPNGEWCLERRHGRTGTNVPAGKSADLASAITLEPK